MDHRVSSCRGCLLGLAVGDAMGYTVDPKTWEEIRLNYGPNGLLGYDLVNGRAEASSYTQIAAYIGNGLLLGTTRGKQEQYPKYIHLAFKEWARRQNLPRDPAKDSCWVSRIPQLRRRHCRDSRMLDALRAETLGTPENPINRADSPGSITAAIMVGLAYDPKYMQAPAVGFLGARAVAMTHGDPETFLSGAVLAFLMAGLLQEPDGALKDHIENAVDAMVQLFAERWPEANDLAVKLKSVVQNQASHCNHQAKMEQLRCFTTAECLAGALYAACVCNDDFDRAMILAVNHSGRSAAVGAITGAILGAQMGVEALPDFYLECLEAKDVLNVLAQDLAQGSPTSGLFDDDWDLKYIQGVPVLP